MTGHTAYICDAYRCFRRSASRKDTSFCSTSKSRLQYSRPFAASAFSLVAPSRPITFEYNEDGLRTKKTSTTLGETVYILHGKNIVHMTNASHNIDIHFYYGADGKPVVMNYNGAMYGFLYNVQGDVVALFNEDSDVTVRYRYGAWGELLNCWGPEASTVGFWQPFRYRGYVFDEETGDYYLRSRYYRPVWCRFVSSDALIRGNLYCYCKGNPIAQTDDDGFEALYTVLTQSMINCYAYAMRLEDGFVIRGDFKVPDLLQPGMASHSPHVMNKDRDKFLSLLDYQNQLIANVYEDAPFFGVSIEPLDNGDGPSDENSWIVALVIDFNPAEIQGYKFWPHPRDYHWYRKESNGYWTHIEGHEDPNFVDEDKQRICDPASCNRGRYNIFVGYFRVVRKHGLTMEDLE